MIDKTHSGPVPAAREERLDRLIRLATGWLDSDANPFLRVQAATMVPRTLLPIGEVELALDVLKALEYRIHPGTPNYPHLYMVIANQAYCHDALAYLASKQGDTDTSMIHNLEVVRLIGRVKEFAFEGANPDPVYQSWHAIALGHAYFHLNDEDGLQHALSDLAELFPAQMRQLGWWYPKLYPNKEFQKRVWDAIGLEPRG